MPQINKSSNSRIFLDSEEHEVLMYAFRYTLGRRTYAPHTMVGILKRNWKMLPIPTKTQITKEILQHKNLYNTLGSECDEKAWMEIVTLFSETEGKQALEDVSRKVQH